MEFAFAEHLLNLLLAVHFASLSDSPVLSNCQLQHHCDVVGLEDDDNCASLSDCSFLVGCDNDDILQSKQSDPMGQVVSPLAELVMLRVVNEEGVPV